VTNVVINNHIVFFMNTEIPEGGGAQSSYMEELLRQQALEEVKS